MDKQRTNNVSCIQGERQANTVNSELLRIWYTNADVLTKDKLCELKEDIKSDYPPDIIAVTEIKPKNYTRQLLLNESP